MSKYKNFSTSSRDYLFNYRFGILLFIYPNICKKQCCQHGRFVESLIFLIFISFCQPVQCRYWKNKKATFLYSKVKNFSKIHFRVKLFQLISNVKKKTVIPDLCTFCKLHYINLIIMLDAFLSTDLEGYIYTSPCHFICRVHLLRLQRNHLLHWL